MRLRPIEFGPQLVIGGIVLLPAISLDEIAGTVLVRVGGGFALGIYGKSATLHLAVADRDVAGVLDQNNVRPEVLQAQTIDDDVAAIDDDEKCLFLRRGLRGRRAADRRIARRARCRTAIDPTRSAG